MLPASFTPGIPPGGLKPGPVRRLRYAAGFTERTPHSCAASGIEPAAVEVFVVPDEVEAPDVLTVDEAADLLRVNRKTLYESIRRGQVPAGRIGGTIRLSRTALVSLLQGNGGPALGGRS
jgi:excisionase family DNA binding protein